MTAEEIEPQIVTLYRWTHVVCLQSFTFHTKDGLLRIALDHVKTCQVRPYWGD